MRCGFGEKDETCQEGAIILDGRGWMLRPGRNSAQVLGEISGLFLKAKARKQAGDCTRFSAKRLNR